MGAVLFTDESENEHNNILSRSLLLSETSDGDPLAALKSMDWRIISGKPFRLVMS
ncbi:hypothetical protein J6590_009264 [Homalodisca vitripennis]|nr:hypothetical protein J6590_009264 [Homalodisca vitripennis]